MSPANARTPSPSGRTASPTRPGTTAGTTTSSSPSPGSTSSGTSRSVPTPRRSGCPACARRSAGRRHVTAGNASPLNDGASAVLLGSEAARDEIGLDPVARIAGRGASALEPQYFGFAPVEAANAALARAGIGWDDVAAVELNEAFAAQSLACLDAWPIDPEIVNRHGGAIAIGHPLGASGGRILGTLARDLQRTGGRWGVACICIGVGQGLAVVLENVSAGATS